MPIEWLRVLRYLHLLFAFMYVGSLIVTEWNGRAARRSKDWRERAILFRVLFMSSLGAGLGGLLLAGILGNVLAVAMGYPMGTTPWLHMANGLWVVAALTMGFVTAAGAARLSRLAQGLAGSGARPEDESAYARSLARWRFGNVANSLFFLAMLWIMVFRPGG